MSKEIVSFRDVDLEILLKKSYGDEMALEKAVEEIIRKVRIYGDEAVKGLAFMYDGADFTYGGTDYNAGFRVTPEEMWEAREAVDPEILRALTLARDNIRAFHEKQKRGSWMEPGADGCVLGQLMIPLERVGIYVPGGTAAYPVSVLMNAVPAMVAGVKEIVMATPPGRDCKLRPEFLAAAELCGVEEIYKMGGAQAIAALAYGTASVKPVHKITGPGNIYVTLAKKLVFGTVDIDMLAGPSEILILADDSGRPEELAADLLSQAEHDKLSSSIVVSPDAALLRAVVDEVERQLPLLPRADIAGASWDVYGAAILVEDLAQGMEVVNAAAPEHFELVVRDPFTWLGRVKNAGAVFVGPYSPEPVGDYVAGPNHILPTGGAARFFSVLNVDSFVKRTSVIHYSREALTRDAAVITSLARMEGLEAHARAVEARLNRDETSRIVG